MTNGKDNNKESHKLDPLKRSEVLQMRNAWWRRNGDKVIARGIAKRKGRRG